MKKIIVLLGFICFFISTGFAQQSGLTQEIKDHINARVETQNNVGMVVAFIDGDKIEYFSAGKTALIDGKDVNEQSVFEIGSISKVFTTIMLSEKIKSGEMSLSDPASKYLPEGVKMPSRNGREITLLDLATHSSSLPRMPDNFTPADPNNPFADYSYQNLYDFLSSCELTRDIGTKSEYSNLGMGLLGHILELQSGKNYEELILERIAKPLGMDDTQITLSESMQERLAKGHSGLQEVPNWDIISMAGAGGIRSTVEDMALFIQANMGNKKSTLYDAMQISHKKAYTNPEGNYAMGLGWQFENDGQVIWHNGQTGGYVAFAGFLPKQNKGVVVLTNSTEDIGALSFKLLGGPMTLQTPKRSISKLIKKEIDTKGIDAGLTLYRTMKTESPEDYKFEEGELNSLGYEYINEKNLEKALAIFKLNVEAHPKASNPYDSLGEAYLMNGEEELAIANYKKSLELNPANDNAIEVLKRLKVDVSDVVKNVEISEDVLNTYVGKYELAPSFHIVVTTKEGRLFAQATGQQKFELFPSDYNKFYLKVVEARVEFNANNKGKIDSMTLFQNGQVMPGKRLE